MAWSAAEVSEPAQPSSTNWADSQRPICAITNKCLFDRNKNDPCKLENLRCVCKYSSSIGKSSYFRSSCLFDTCYSELGRQEWMNAFAYACNMVNKTLFDITPQWERYIPQWYLDSLPSTTTAAAYPTSATIVTNNPHTDISEGGIAGISVAAITAAVLLAICGLIFWRKDQKLKRKSREVAQMADAMQPRGVQQRIDQLTYGSSSDEDVRPEPLQNNDKHEIYAHVGKSRDGNGEGGQHGCLQSLPLFNLRTSSTPYPHGTAELLQSPQITHQPYPYERSIGRRVSHRSAMAGRTSTDNMGTTAVTSSPVERYPVEHDVGNDTARSRAPVYDEHGGKVTWG
ncbi:hypothetical protein DE146DRAFT_634467 [Phaeosphaeria sp. MPI-PUGE-AT-0046c]|nr:hypothetical protein DE146DRAFT_634467 [Phaeosphaeria sp. MPI-PUGE-AT-0046c]